MLIANIGLTLVSFLIFLFIFWKRLKEDHHSNIIFSSGFFILFAVLIFWYISTFFSTAYTFWIFLLGSFLGLAFSIIRFKMRFYETFEAFVVSSIPVLSVFYLYHAVNQSSTLSFIFFAVTLFLLFAFYFLDLNYKSFNWYKSGRIGLCGLLVFIMFFIAKIILDWGDNLNLYLSGIVVIISSWQLYRIQKI